MSAGVAWFLYSTIVAFLLGLAAVAAESALRSGGKCGRWAWVVAMPVSVALPLLAWLGLSVRLVPAVAESGLMPLVSLPPVTVGIETGTVVAGPGLDQVLRLSWLFVTAGMLVYMGLSWVAIAGERRNWRRATIGGVRVAVTVDIGPAVWGVRRPEILLPEWAVRLESRVRRLMLLHEGEHVRAGDTRIVMGGLLLLAAAPWNIPLWWQLRRLRQAVELDCDARVLRRAPDARRYGALLLEVGRRRAAPVLAVALADPPSFLERRIRLITAKAGMPSMRRMGGFGLVAALLVAVAVCTREPMAAMRAAPVAAAVVMEPLSVVQPVMPARELKDPIEVGVASASEAVPSDDERSGSGQGDRPVPYDAPPVAVTSREPVREPSPVTKTTDGSTGRVAIDSSAVTDAASRSTAADARTVEKRAGDGVRQPDGVRNAVSSAGAPGVVSSGSVAPPAGQRLAAVGPDRIEVRELTAWRNDDGAAGPDPARRVASTREADPAKPPVTKRPQLENLAEIQDLMEREYPPLLRDAGIGGNANVWSLVGADGTVLRTQVTQGTGHPELDEAALRVASAMRFSPAINGGDAAPVWVSLPIAFVSR